MPPELVREGESIPRVLVVDDDRMTQMLLRRNLTQAGYEVESASDGKEALEKLATAPYDLVVLDFVMPGMDGYEVLGKITADERMREVPVVVVSGIDDKANAALLVEAGAADYLTKPVDGGLLRARSARCIEAKRSREREQRLLEEVRASYAKLRESEAVREQLTHMIVHDLRTPLTSLLGSLKLLTSGKVPEGGQAPMLDLALATGSSLNEMINELLELHRLESGADIIDKATIPVDRPSRAAVDKVRGLAETRGVALKVEAPNDEAPLDESKLERVLVNLLGNAIKYSPRGTEVALEVTSRDGETRFEVVDHGPGIPERDRERIFERFYRGANQDMPSTGLGLAFCKLAIESHGGKIWVDSKVGEGSRFVVALPR
jgi:two-component system sensor histidine kinase/response regulator